MKKKYNIVFYGKIKLGWDVGTVKKNFSRLMKKSEGNIDLLFSGKPVVLKKNIERHTAEKFKTGFEKIGAICEIQEIPDKTNLNNLTMEESASDKTDIKKPAEPLFVCPKCGFQQIYSRECRQCGIVFSKFLENEKKEESKKQAPQEISKEMEEGVTKAKAIGMAISMKNQQPYDLRQILRVARIGLVVLIFIAVASYTVWSNWHIAGWEETLDVVIYPINGDQSEQIQEFIGTLDAEDFRPIETFMMDEAASYDLELEKPVAIHLAPEIEALPPEPPKNRSRLNVMWWSLKMRYWAFKHNTYKNSLDIRMFVIYKTIKSTQTEVSVGLRKGLMGIVNTSPDAQSQDYTNIIIAHEMLHTFEATDKYDYSTLMPKYPEGYADPDKKPLHPQSVGEIMAVRIPKSRGSFSMPESLDDIIIGEKTCIEIKWCKEEGE